MPNNRGLKGPIQRHLTPTVRRILPRIRRNLAKLFLIKHGPGVLRRARSAVEVKNETRAIGTGKGFESAGRGGKRRSPISGLGWSPSDSRNRRICFCAAKQSKQDSSLRSTKSRASVMLFHRERVTQSCHSEEVGRRPTRNLVLCEKQKKQIPRCARNDRLATFISIGGPKPM
jgi:hypothetical protein